MARIYVTEAEGAIQHKLRSQVTIRDYYSTVEGPHPNSSLIIPFLKVFNWTLLVPNKIEYSKEQKCYICKEGSRLAKSLSYILLILMTMYMSVIFFNDVNTPSSIRAIISKVTWASYTLFDGIAIKCLRKGHKIAKLLSEASRISCLCDQINIDNGKSVKKRTKYEYFGTWIACATGLIYTALFVLIVIVELTATTTNLYSLVLNTTSLSGNKTELGNENLNCAYSDIWCNLIAISTSNTVIATLLTFWLLIAFLVEMIWVVFLMMTASWAFYFKKMLGNCIGIIATSKLDLPEGIGMYTRVTVLLEYFNEVFGSTFLWIVIASILYKAATLGEFLAGYTHGILYDTINILGFVPFILTVYVASEVHRMGSILPFVLKKQFLDLTMRDNNQSVQIIHSTSVVQYDALSNNVGFKGLGFFTISYTFVASLVGITITYSLVTLQFKLGEIAIN